MTLAELSEQRNEQWRAAGLHRSPGVFDSAQDTVAHIDGRDYVLFSSSNYLSLSIHPAVTAAASDALARFGVGSGGSRLTTGTTTLHQQVEEEFARFVGAEDAVYFATGYQANLSTIAALRALTQDLTIFSDALNHASIIDGCRMSKLPLQVYPHADLTALSEMLRGCTTAHALVVTDGLFSMDGDIAPIPDLQQLCHEHGAWLMVDDAHAVGTLGQGGRGTSEHFGCLLPDILVGTASKALGAEGGFVCCSKEFGTFLRNRARSFVFSTATPASSPAAIIAALGLVEAKLPALRRNIAYVCSALEIDSTPSPIIPILIGDETEAMRRSSELKEAGLWVPAIRYPTVARGKAILRITIMADHTQEQLDKLVKAVGK